MTEAEAGATPPPQPPSGQSIDISSQVSVPSTYTGNTITWTITTNNPSLGGYYVNYSFSGSNPTGFWYLDSSGNATVTTTGMPASAGNRYLSGSVWSSVEAYWPTWEGAAAYFSVVGPTTYQDTSGPPPYEDTSGT